MEKEKVQEKSNKIKDAQVTNKKIKRTKFNLLDSISFYFAIGLGIICFIFAYKEQNADWIAVLVVPLLFSSVDALLQKKRENDLYNIDCWLEHNIKGLIWKDSKCDNSNKGYIVIQNTGETVSYKTYIEVIDEQNDVKLYCCDEMLYKDEKIIIEVPIKIKSIKEVWISSFLSPETRTKFFSEPTQAEDNQYIFSNVKHYDSEHKAVCRKYKNSEFCRLKRDYIR